MDIQQQKVVKREPSESRNGLLNILSGKFDVVVHLQHTSNLDYPLESFWKTFRCQLEFNEDNENPYGLKTIRVTQAIIRNSKLDQLDQFLPELRVEAEFDHPYRLNHLVEFIRCAQVEDDDMTEEFRSLDLAHAPITVVEVGVGVEYDAGDGLDRIIVWTSDENFLSYPGATAIGVKHKLTQTRRFLRGKCLECGK